MSDEADLDDAVKASLKEFGKYQPETYAAYHAEDACNENFYAFVEKSIEMFKKKKKEQILSLLDKCIKLRKEDHERHLKMLPREGKDAEKDATHAAVIVMFEQLREKIDSIQKDLLPKYRFLLNKNSIYLRPKPKSADKVLPPQPGWEQVGKRRRTRRKNGRRRTRR